MSALLHSNEDGAMILHYFESEELGALSVCGDAVMGYGDKPNANLPDVKCTACLALVTAEDAAIEADVERMEGR